MRALILLFTLAVLSAPQALWAQESLSVTVTPPLFQLSISPGEDWSSSVKVVNNNEYDVTYYANVVDFEAEGEEGKGRFVPLIESLGGDATSTFSLASWIRISRDPVVVSAGESRSIPFTVAVPPDAEPGGHYAAILVGTQPPETIDGPTLRVSSFVSSLLFTRVNGEVIESGRVREFRTAETLYERAAADFIVRFENTGTTHLKPQGDVTIYNMWGKERGSLAINQKTNFGNVLPRSTRRFEFAWEGEPALFDIGRYRAVVTLSFGEESRQNVSAVAYFWVVPTGPVVVTTGTVLIFALLLGWFIRRYIRHALALERERLGAVGMRTVVPSVRTLMEPLREGVVDLRAAARGTQVAQNLPVLKDKYRGLKAFFAVLLVFLALCILYFVFVLVPERSFQIGSISAGNEELLSEQVKQ